MYRLAEKPIIAALRELSQLEAALHSGVDICFFMGGSINEIKEAVTRAKAENVGAFIHIDLVKGLSRSDKEAVDFAANYIGADGIITPKAHLIQEAKRNGLVAIQHLFIIDSLAMGNAMRMVESVKPDAIEIMPGVITKTIARFAEAFEHIPLIASGLIETESEVNQCLDAGATGISTSQSKLWGLTYGQLR
ncbi:transcriptional regulator [Paenibacillus baekrokdamisoli]|uniref:Glycerol uptake operon antiterminator regulatory protein n=1 Tax=Paenibacillus baekrokdamisoli TaxID=1712516 RepID=A0A3G9J917_9BACL|nr:glycerol-3-phosphate responsive antiterminator [Paenibacillus baekrokdamisoli]MBB3067262.1 glycerol uptake operon antiterminator [Paenibacillus baekrokdamisoli]BBH19549.1 transcriptional regulator [Paenibacillus baekrokdamisoli]